LKRSSLRREIEEELAPVSPSPQGEAAFILRELGIDSPIAEIDPTLRLQIRGILDQRVQERVPVQYIFNRSYFMDLTLYVEPGIFIPRPETERLAEIAMELSDGTRPGRVLEVGTGSGAVMLSLKREFPDIFAVATDVSRRALRVARENGDRNGVSGPIRWVLGRGLGPFPEAPTFDLIVSNPPYVSPKERNTLAPEVRMEPGDALFSGQDGLELTRELMTGGRHLLRSSGHLALEIDPRSADGLLETGAMLGYLPIVKQDLSGRDRVLILRKR
jgi:release factor glutamine methyltransferase